MRRVDADLPQKFAAQRGKKPTFDPFRLSDLLLVLSQEKESLLRQVRGFGLIFRQGQTKPVNGCVVLESDRFQVYPLGHLISRFLVLAYYLSQLQMAK
jgi:hypothetical protein